MRWLASLLLVLLAATFARASPPPGVGAGGVRHMWWECHREPVSRLSCCSEADGHSLSDTEWRIADGGYQVSVEGRWWGVPVDAVLIGDTCGPDPAIEAQSEAKVWYRTERAPNNELAAVAIHCFLPGTFY